VRVRVDATDRQALLAIPPHPNIIPLYSAFLVESKLHYAFEVRYGDPTLLTRRSWRAISTS